MNAQIQNALAEDRVIDITTIGRKSGDPVRKEMWFHNIDGDIYITGTPGKRDWYANVVANPDFTFHLKVSTSADLDATARPITEDDEKRAVLQRILANLERTDEIDNWVENSPLIEVAFSTS
jgi:deazaflavin-dependent oxidoreductase (nitroreductase family)